MRPFLKWAGGKHRLVEIIKGKLSAGSRLLEPFAGSCALSLETDFPAYWLNDINPDLINLYKVLQQEGDIFIEFCRSFFTERNNTAERFYLLRKQFNREKDIKTKSAIFLYLNRHCYNGLCRYNASGEYNVPFGKYKKPYFPDKELRYFYEKFNKAVFSIINFEEMMLAAEVGDVIYCDPPYVPLNETSNFTAYSSGGFGQTDQIRLAKTASKLAERGIKTIISNHCNEFILDIYREAEIVTFPVQRSISCDGDNRNAVEEVLAVFG